MIHLIYLLSFLYASECTQWRSPIEIGLLPTDSINESSGIEVSAQFANRLYHINDSGDGPYFYITEMDGSKVEKIEVSDFDPFDVEDITLATYQNKDYIVIADIGDNLRVRSHVTLHFIEETKTFNKIVKPVHVVKITYPNNQKLNAEAISFHPSGDLYIFTKSEDVIKGKAFPFSIYRVTKDVFLNRVSDVIAQHISDVDLPALLPKQNWLGQIVTALDIDSKGNWVLLTYKQAIYSNLDITKPLLPVERWKKDVDYILIDLPSYPQIEAVSFVNQGKSFIFTTEYKKKFKKAPIGLVECTLFKK